MHLLCNKQNMDDLAAEALGVGRKVADRAKTLHLGENARDVAFVSRCLARLKERQRRLVSPHRYRPAGVLGGQNALPPTPTRHQTRSTAIHVASMKRYTLPSSGSYTS